jgi:glutaredoxin
MRVLAMVLALAALGAGVVLATREGDTGSLLLAALESARPVRPLGPAAPPRPRTAAAAPAASVPSTPAASQSEPLPTAAIELIRGGERTVIEDAAAGADAEPIPLYRYIDASGSIRMVEGLQRVPPEQRDGARRVRRGGGALNRLRIPTPSHRSFRDWQPEFNPNRTEIALFSAPGCSACARARAHLDRLGVIYELRDIQRDRGARDEVRQILGRVVVPLLQVGSRYVSGYLPGEYDRVATPAG